MRYVLATDLDGTFIPFDDEPQQFEALHEIKQRLAEHHISLVFVTGRHLESVERVIALRNLPIPGWIISDVGSSVSHCDDGNRFQRSSSYANHLETLLPAAALADLRERFSRWPELEPQEAAKQTRYKASFYTEAARLSQMQEKLLDAVSAIGVACEIIVSIDPFNHQGLIDLLPPGVNKASALAWWSRDQNVAAEKIVYAGDSGNDLAALTSEYRSIVVGNAHRELIDRVTSWHQQRGVVDRLFVSTGRATSGVLEGGRRFGLWD